MINPTISEDVKNIIERLKPEIKKLEEKTVLISGGAGFIGRYFLYVFLHLNENFLKKPCKVICVDNFITSSKNNIKKDFRSSHFTFINHDVSKKLNIKTKLDYIIHAAGIASPIYYHKYPLQAIDVNTIGTKNFLEIANKNRLKSFLYFSSSEIYGDPDKHNIPTPETYRGNVSSIGPRSCYDESKRLGEALTVNYYAVYKIPVKIVRPFNIYGPGMNLTDYRVMPTFLYNALKNKNLPVHDTGKQTRTYCYVSDAIVALLKVLLSGKNGEVYNIGNDKPEISTIDLAKLVKQKFNKHLKITLVSYPNNYPRDVPQRRCPDLKKLRVLLKYNPVIELSRGLELTMKWYKETYGSKKI